MFRRLRLLQRFYREIKTKCPQRNASTITENIKGIDGFGWFLLVIPVSTFGLGTWQIYRKQWKEQLMADLRMKTRTEPVPLPEDLTELKSMEYYPVTVKGRFDYSKEMYLGPRSLLIDNDASTESSLISSGQRQKNGSSGYLIVTPFHLSDRNLTILVNRGWVPAHKKHASTRPEGQVDKELVITGVVRLNEDRPPFMPKNIPQSNSWLYRDLDEMCRRTGAAPVFLEAISECSIEGGPIGGQTRIALRNEHLSYTLTWYSLSAFTGFLWHRQFIRKLPLV